MLLARTVFTLLGFHVESFITTIIYTTLDDPEKVPEATFLSIYKCVCTMHRLRTTICEHLIEPKDEAPSYPSLIIQLFRLGPIATSQTVRSLQP